MKQWIISHGSCAWWALNARDGYSLSKRWIKNGKYILKRWQSYEKHSMKNEKLKENATRKNRSCSIFSLVDILNLNCEYAQFRPLHIALLNRLVCAVCASVYLCLHKSLSVRIQRFSWIWLWFKIALFWLW